MARPKHVALLLDIANDYARRTLTGIRQYALAHADWRYARRGTQTVVSPDQLGDWSGDGVIAHVNHPTLVERLSGLGVPIVNVSATLTEMPFASVTSDEIAVGRAAAEHLIARGHTALLCFKGGPSRWSVERERGFMDHVTAHCLTARAVMIEESRQRACFVEALAECDAPVGCFCVNDIRARQLVSHATEAGLQVPEDVAVVGVDDDRLQRDLSVVPLSSVRPDYEKIGYEAAVMLTRLMAGEAAGSDPAVPPERVVVRASSDGLAVVEPRVRDAIRFIQAHLHEPIGIADLLGEVPVSRRWLEYRFKQRIGVTPFQYLTAERMKLARRLLIETDLAVKQIAGRVGYETARHFSEAFKRHTGHNPTEVRDHHAMK